LYLRRTRQYSAKATAMGRTGQAKFTPQMLATKRVRASNLKATCKTTKLRSNINIKRWIAANAAIERTSKAAAQDAGELVVESKRESAANAAATKVVTKEATDLAAKHTTAKIAGTVVPLISLGFAAIAISERWANPENRKSVGMIAYNLCASVGEVGSGIAGCFPGLGTALSVAIDVGVGCADVCVAVSQADEDDEKPA